MRRRKVLRGLCSARLSGNSYLVVGALAAVLVPVMPVVGAALTPIIAALGVFLAGAVLVTIIGSLLAPIVL